MANLRDAKNRVLHCVMETFGACSGNTMKHGESLSLMASTEDLFEVTDGELTKTFAAARS